MLSVDCRFHISAIMVQRLSAFNILHVTAANAIMSLSHVFMLLMFAVLDLWRIFNSSRAETDW